jgi:hypothetical protein
LGFGSGSDVLVQSKFSFILTTLATEKPWSENVPECHRGRRRRRKIIVINVIIKLSLHK